MSERFTAVLGVVLLCLALSVILKCLGSRSAPILIALVSVGVITLFSESLSELVSTLTGLSSYSDVTDYVRGAMKIAGVGYLSGICSDICSELGEAGLAKILTLAGRLEIFAITAPYISEIIEYALRCAA